MFNSSVCIGTSFRFGFYFSFVFFLPPKLFNLCRLCTDARTATVWLGLGFLRCDCVCD